MACVIPVSSVPAEWGFSLQNWIKTALRSRLQEEKIAAPKMAGLAPIVEMRVEDDGHEIPIVMWREAALQHTTWRIGQEVRVSHLRPVHHPTFGAKLNSTQYTSITEPVERQEQDEEVQVTAIVIADDSYVLLLNQRGDLHVPAEKWTGNLEDVIEDLPRVYRFKWRGSTLTCSFPGDQ
ncbi:hypothetical protein SKAU_G00207780 [Synaphobranchus kaupii]|uniref:Uncharacterized protein n=1 Tax=Synaphobranchus kaupii TaxID=118154 RepID=A0A9Q1F8T3_SYNKA|nr:hypothetical protein SKAU_G00207780 [Synaphobranchus kaupii]